MEGSYFMKKGKLYYEQWLELPEETKEQHVRNGPSVWHQDEVGPYIWIEKIEKRE